MLTAKSVKIQWSRCRWDIVSLETFPVPTSVSPRTPDRNLARQEWRSRIGNDIATLTNAPDSFNDDGAGHLLVFKFDLSSAPASDNVSVYLDPLDALDFPAQFFERRFYSGAIGATRANSVVRVGAPSSTRSVLVRSLRTFCRPNLQNSVPVQIWVSSVILAIVQNMNQFGNGFVQGDLNNDSRIDLYDLRIWRNNRTDITGFPQIASVPEPTGLAMILSASQEFRRLRASRTI